MNIYESDVLVCIAACSIYNQRDIAEKTGHALGLVNRAIKSLIEQGYISNSYTLTEAGEMFVNSRRPKHAIILAAGYGLRMVPISADTPKGLLEVRGEALIERLIRQLQLVGISDITVVVGYLKEQFEYLIDRYQVRLVVNMDYSSKNNLHSLRQSVGKLEDCYIVPCDIWCADNPFRHFEPYSWYMVTDEQTLESGIRLNRKHELVLTDSIEKGNKEVGICYVAQEDGIRLQTKLVEMAEYYDDSFWEVILPDKGRYCIKGRCVKKGTIIEINTYEDLRGIDCHSGNLNSVAVAEIQSAFSVTEEEIQDISVLKKGMTNRSFLFSCRGKKYIMRIPGEGTEELINREQESEVYHEILDKGICDNVVYLNPKNGYKITEYFAGSRVCDASSSADVSACMTKLRQFHNKGLKVTHVFDLFAQLQRYEDLRGNKPSVYRDYYMTKQNVFSLRTWIERYAETFCLTHIDAIADNFLFVPEASGEALYLIDWEYAGMQDPHVDIAMFSIYSNYDRKAIDNLCGIFQ